MFFWDSGLLFLFHDWFFFLFFFFLILLSPSCRWIFPGVWSADDTCIFESQLLLASMYCMRRLYLYCFNISQERVVLVKWFCLVCVRDNYAVRVERPIPTLDRLPRLIHPRIPLQHAHEKVSKNTRRLADAILFCIPAYLSKRRRAACMHKTIGR
ncbi:hypothetical protein N658DRAFT_187225 [Parathielavia hyrcaniae]|uniref:Uncharacterized protein n=1 Tax=Parathielavia hyrcaniae TaxID=113614 RepID=A0AAN6T5D9_9PEZI|nr:hypothetical protein N658DRAFT_187225 [Parathielavia hyrcaniae]